MVGYVRRNIMLSNGNETDIEYVERQFRDFTVLWPASSYYDSTRFLIRGYSGGSSKEETWPKRRALPLMKCTDIRKPNSWWGSDGGYYIRPDANEYTMIHIPPSINTIKVKHSASGYQIAIDTFYRQTTPIKLRDSQYGWISPTSYYNTIDFSDLNYDTWILFSIRSGDEIIPFTTSDEMKQLLNLEIIIE